MNFTTTISESRYISEYGLAKFLGVEIDSTFIEARVKWEVEFETRDWGINDVYIYIHSVEISGSYSYYDNKDVECLELLDENLPDTKHFTIVNEMEMTKDGVTVEEVEIDFNTKTITVK